MKRYAIIWFAGLAAVTAIALNGAILATFLTVVTALLFPPPSYPLLAIIPGAGIICWILGIVGLAVLERRSRRQPNSDQPP